MLLPSFNTVKIGDVIQLRPSAFEHKFLETEPLDWSKKYLYKDRFKHVYLRFKTINKAGDRAITLFGSSLSRVERIEYLEGKPFIIWTELFEIFLAGALEKDEVFISSDGKNHSLSSQAEKELVDNLDYFEYHYLDGLFSVAERENNKLDMYKRGFYTIRKEGKWQSSVN